MALEPAELDAIRAAIRDAIDSMSHPCRFGMVSDEEAQEAGHFIGMVSDLGEDRGLSGGIETIRNNHQWLARVITRTNTVGMAIAVIIASTFVAGVLSAVWLGVKVMLLKAGN